MNTYQFTTAARKAHLYAMMAWSDKYTKEQAVKNNNTAKRRSKNLDKSTLTSLQGGERSCACIASYKCGEGVHSVRETISCKFAPNPCYNSITRFGGGGKKRLAQAF